MEIEQIYKEIILNGFYDESYGMNPQTINGKIHGVCIDFSRKLIKRLKENKYLAGLISTNNSDGYLHATVIYKNLITDELFIADPVTDIKELTGLSDEERKKQINEILDNGNFEKELREYIEMFGEITEYDDSQFENDLTSPPKVRRSNLSDREDIEANPDIAHIKKIAEAIQQLVTLEDVKKVADGPTLLACQTLYKKGIATICSNYGKEGYIDISFKYDSLSDENKRIFEELRKSNPENFFIRNESGFYSGLGENEERRGNTPLVGVVGFSNLPPDMSTGEINLKMNELISSLKKQIYLDGVYTRDEILANKHNHYELGTSVASEEPKCIVTEEDSNSDIADKENLLYSLKYNLFFRDFFIKSRYVESLYRRENDWRSQEEIAEDAGIFYSVESGMFFESEKEYKLFNLNSEIGKSRVKMFGENGIIGDSGVDENEGDISDEEQSFQLDALPSGNFVANGGVRELNHGRETEHKGLISSRDIAQASIIYKINKRVIQYFKDMIEKFRGYGR